MINFCKQVYHLLIVVGDGLRPFVLFAMRLFWGGMFFLTGIDKLSHIGPIIDYFQSLGIPFPTLQAYLVGCIETVGGACLFVGFASRLVCLPLMAVMIVALLTAHREAVSMILINPQEITMQTPFNFFLTALIIFVCGPGMISADALIKRWDASYADPSK